jgi:CubicO group peptidase (beta-lactamase class C family)
MLTEAQRFPEFAAIVAREGGRGEAVPKIEATGGQFYGHLWFLGRSLPNGREVRWDGAPGRGGQSIRIVPELDLVVVVTAGYYQDYSPQAFQVQSGIFRDTYGRFAAVSLPRRNHRPNSSECAPKSLSLSEPARRGHA